MMMNKFTGNEYQSLKSFFSKDKRQWDKLILNLRNHSEFLENDVKNILKIDKKY